MTPPETPHDSADAGGESESSPGSDERDLIQRCIDGDVSAFEPLVERYRQRVWRLAYQILRDREEAWDVAQEAFVRAFHSLSSFRGQSAFYTWLFRITVNVATDRQRSRGAQARAFGAERVPEEEWERTMPDPGARPDTSAVRAEQRARIREGLDALPPKARTIIMLSDVEGLSYREIAEVLRCPIGTVMSRLHNARKRLKALLGPMLVVLLWLVAVVVHPGLVDAQPMIRFGVRVLYASNSPGGPEPAPPPGSGPAPRSARPAPPPPPAPSESPPGAGPSPGVRAIAPPPPGTPPPAPPSGQTVSPAPGHVGPPPAPPPGTRADGDERLRRILPQLRAVFRYSEYTPIERHRIDGPLGTAQRFSIPGDRWLEVTPDKLQGTMVRMHVRLLRGDQPEMNASLLAAPGAPAIFGGPAYGSGVLIIVLWVNPYSGIAPPRTAPDPPVRSR